MDHIAPLRQGGCRRPPTSISTSRTTRCAADRNVSIDYYLKQAAQNVKMEFLDPDGKVIRTFTGTPADAERKPPAEGADDGPRRPPEPHPAVAAG
jgi:hypothetical protein